VSNLVEGRIYFFAVSAYNGALCESSLSNEVSYQVPGPNDPTVSISVSRSEIKEGETIRYLFTLSKGKRTAPLTVRYALRGDAILGTDYTLTGRPGEVTFRAGRSLTTVKLTAMKTAWSKGSERATMLIIPGEGYKISASAGKGDVIISGPP
jgi:hypothetical protein